MRYAGLFDDDGGEHPDPDGIADHVIHDHAELPGVLGSGLSGPRGWWSGPASIR